MNIAVAESAITLFTPRPSPVAVLTDREEFDRFYAEIKQAVAEFVPDVSTQKGRDAIKALAFKITKTKTFLDEAGKNLNAEKRHEIDLVDASRRHMRDQLEELKSEARRPLTEWEEAEAARVQTIASTMDYFRVSAEGSYGAEVSALIDRLEQVRAEPVDPSIFRDEAIFAEKARQDAIDSLTLAIERAKKEEADRAELARLRAANEARDREDARLAAEKAEAERKDREAATQKAREEAATRAAAEAAEREARRRADEALAAMEAVHQAELRKEQEERKRLEDAERQRQADEARAAEEQRKREADREHRAKLIADAREAVIACGKVSENAAQKIVLAIVAGEIPSVSMRF